MDKLRQHNVVLCDGDLCLRPMTDDDWDIVFPWTTDPDILYFSEGCPYEDMDSDAILRSVREESNKYKAFLFIIESGGVPIGDCCLQDLSKERLTTRFPGKDCRQLDIEIGAKEFWGKGIGTRVIRLLSRFAFESEHADLIFALVWGHNPRSRKAFEKNGYVLYHEYSVPDGIRAKSGWDLLLTNEQRG
jgi:RimJ/RimL family protein N-acetyltransferase